MPSSTSTPASATPSAIIDLRSDTVTRPCPAMRQAIASAEVGDDMYGEDPSVNRLQERVADLIGTEDALFVPTGSMANQIAIKVLTQPGESMLAGASAHNWMFEAGAAGFISSIQITILPGDGRFTADDVHAAYLPDSLHYAPTRLVSLENTHNLGGGIVWDMAQQRAVLAAADELGLGKHLDGARLWNAAARRGVSERELAAGFDTISVCLSKGLGAPAGSLLCGSRETIRKALRIRRILGGAMRQSGILAAAGLYALEHNRARLVDDHDNAAFLARELDKVPGLRVDLDTVHTNIVMVDVERPRLDARTLVQQARERGLLVLAPNPGRMRLVTHLDVDRAACDRAVNILGALAKHGS